MTRSIQASAANSTAPTFAQAPTSTGITAGDYVYKSGGSYNSVSDTALTSGSFPITATNQATYGYMSGGNSTTSSTVGSSRTRQSSAVLQNGNVVTVYANAFTGSFYPMFKIDTQAGVAVVSPTTISTTYAMGGVNNNIGVIVLASGNFVVFWQNDSGGSAGYPNYAIYTQTGGSVLSATQDTSTGYPITSTYGYLEGTALTGGGFVLGYNSSLVVFRIYTSGGSGAYTASLLGSATANQILGMAARSDGSFCVAWQSGATTVRYQVISATNTILSDANFSVTAFGATYPVSVTCLPNDTFVIAYFSSTSPKFRLLPTGNTLGAEVTVPFPTASYKGSVPYMVNVKSLSSGGFIFSFWDDYQIINYNFYNSTGTSLSTTLQILNSFVVSSYSSLSYAPICMVEYTSSVAVFAVQGVSPVAGYQLFGMSAFQIDKTTYALTLTNPAASVTAGSVTAALSGYARSSSAPESASFFAAASQTATISGAVTTGAITQTQMSTTAIQTVALCALANGTGFAALLCPDVNGSAQDFVQIYDTNMVLQRTITLPAQTHNQNYYQNFKITLLTSGNLAVVIGYPAGSSFVAYVISPTLGTIVAGPSTSIGAYNTYNGSNYFFSLCGIYLDRFIITYYNTGAGSTYTDVFSYSGSTITRTAQISGSVPGTCYGSFCGASLTGNGFYTAGHTSSYSTTYANYWRETSPGSNSWTNTMNNSSSFSGYNNQVSSGNYMAVNSNNIAYVPSANSGSNFTPTVVTQISQQGFVKGINLFTLSQNTYANAVSTNGQFVTFAVQSTSGYVVTSSAGGGVTYNSISGMNTATNSCAAICPLFGPFMVIAWRDSSTSTPYMAKVAVEPYSYSASIVAGVTPSTTALALTPTTGYTLSGVSVNSATAGNTAQVQVNGVAKLGAGYNASQATTYFDSTGLINKGVRGSVTGLNVILEGNE